jgi:hypothetical protein
MNIAKTDYDDAARLQATKAKAALLKTINDTWAKAEAMAKDTAKAEVNIVNLLRSCGLALQELAGHEQVKFEFFHSLEDELPKGLHFKAVKVCVHLARELKQPAETLDDARRARQMMFEAFDQMSAPRRIAAQSAHERNPWSDFVSTAASFTRLFGDLDAEHMAGWGQDKLSTFVRETAPIVEKHLAAKQLMEKGGAS